MANLDAQAPGASQTPQAPAAPVAATIDELSSLYSERPAFVLEQLKAKATLVQAEGAFLRLELKESKAAATAAEARAVSAEAKAKTAAAKGSDDAIPFRDDDDNGASASGHGDFLFQAKAIAKAKGISKTAAMKQLARDEPELHASFKDHCRTLASTRRRGS